MIICEKWFKRIVGGEFFFLGEVVVMVFEFLVNFKEILWLEYFEIFFCLVIFEFGFWFGKGVGIYLVL